MLLLFFRDPFLSTHKYMYLDTGSCIFDPLFLQLQGLFPLLLCSVLSFLLCFSAFHREVCVCIVILYFLSSSFFIHSFNSILLMHLLSHASLQLILWHLSPLSPLNPLTGGRELPTTERHSVYENGTLIISDTSRELDEGVYVCRAVNDKGEQHSRNLQLQVLSESTARVVHHLLVLLSSTIFPISQLISLLMEEASFCITFPCKLSLRLWCRHFLLFPFSFWDPFLRLCVFQCVKLALPSLSLTPILLSHTLSSHIHDLQKNRTSVLSDFLIHWRRVWVSSPPAPF